MTYTWNGHEFGSAGLPPTILLSSNVGIVSLGPTPQTAPAGLGVLVDPGWEVVPHVTGLGSVEVGQQNPNVLLVYKN